MATQFNKIGNIKYINKDFASFKRDLMRFSQAHHSGVFQDFNESSVGMAILEFQAFVGDVLSFHQDMQFEELKQDSQRQISNAVSTAKQLGYKPAGKRASRGVETFFIEVPMTTAGGVRVPDDAYTPVMIAGGKVLGPNGNVFETVEDVYFSASLPTIGTSAVRQVTGSRFDNTTGLPTHFAIRKDVEIVAGETKTDSFTVSSFQQFLSLELTNSDVIEIISVIDSDNNEWVEVDYLAQDMVFDSIVNDGTDNDTVPYILRLTSAPRRFISDYDPATGKTSLIFGSGDGVNFDDELIPNIADMALPLPGRRTFSSQAIDPQNFLKTRSLGLSPYNTTLTVRYRVGGGSETNVPVATIKTVGGVTLSFSTTNLDATKKAAVVNSVECLNMTKTDGGGPAESIGEMKVNSSAFFAAQNRVVVREDFIARVLSLPAKFGRPEKVYVRRNASGNNSNDIHILAKDSDGHLTQATSNLMQNVATYLKKFRMLTDGINLLQTDIINLRLNFGIVVSPKYNRTEVLAKCLNTMRDYLHTDKMQTGHPIVLSDMTSEIQNILGVVSVYKLELSNVFGNQGAGLSYSTVRYDVRANTSNGILYCPENAIFEIKFPTKDIIGDSK